MILNPSLSRKKQIIRKKIEKKEKLNDLILEERAASITVTKNKKVAKSPIVSIKAKRSKKTKTVIRRRVEAEEEENKDKDKDNVTKADKDREIVKIAQKTETEKRNTDDQPDSL